jgi:hypothetical protein
MTIGHKTGACQDLRSQDGGAFRFGFPIPIGNQTFLFLFFLKI